MANATKVGSDHQINWNTPEIRDDIFGFWDKFIGPGATTSENVLILIPGIIAGFFEVLYAYYKNLQWSCYQNILGFLITFDIVSGAIANSTNVLKRWYHREGRKFKDHLIFALVHIYPILLGWLFKNNDWIYGITLYSYFVVSSIIVLLVPLYMKRPTATLLTIISIFISFYVFNPVKGFEWLYTVLFIKIINGNLIREEPYRPL